MTIKLAAFKGISKDPTPVRRAEPRWFKTPMKSASILRGAVVPIDEGGQGPEGYRLLELGEPWLYQDATGVTLTKESEGVYLMECQQAVEYLGVCWATTEKFDLDATPEVIGMFQREHLAGATMSRLAVCRWKDEPTATNNRKTGPDTGAQDPRVFLQGNAPNGRVNWQEFPFLGADYFWYRNIATAGTKWRLWTPAIWIKD